MGFPWPHRFDRTDLAAQNRLVLVMCQNDVLENMCLASSLSDGIFIDRHLNVFRSLQRSLICDDTGYETIRSDMLKCLMHTQHPRATDGHMYKLHMYKLCTCAPVTAAAQQTTCKANDDLLQAVLIRGHRCAHTRAHIHSQRYTLFTAFCNTPQGLGTRSCSKQLTQNGGAQLWRRYQGG